MCRFTMLPISCEDSHLVLTLTHVYRIALRRGWFDKYQSSSAVCLLFFIHEIFGDIQNVTNSTCHPSPFQAELCRPASGLLTQKKFRFQHWRHHPSV